MKQQKNQTKVGVFHQEAAEKSDQGVAHQEAVEKSD
jgi:hypothetical protein